MRENLVRILFRQAHPVIAHADLDKPIPGGGGNENAPVRDGSLLHRFERIHDQVKEHLLELNRVPEQASDWPRAASPPWWSAQAAPPSESRWAAKARKPGRVKSEREPEFRAEVITRENQQADLERR